MPEMSNDGNNNKNLNTKTTKKFFCHSEKLFQFILCDAKDLLQFLIVKDIYFPFYIVTLRQVRGWQNI